MEVYTKPLYDDFTGFIFNGKHSSQFGLLRVSDGSRYEETLVPDLTDTSEEVPGGAGEYYFGEDIKKKTMKVSFAFDNLTEKDLKRIKKWLHPDDGLHELIFDERPYVKYLVKCSKAVTAKLLCFDEYRIIDSEPTKVRIYKGDGDIEFTAYMPYGIARAKYWNDPLLDIGNVDEWKESSKLLSKSDSESALINRFSGGVAKIYNGGDVDTGWILQAQKKECCVTLSNKTQTSSIGYKLTEDAKPEEDKTYYCYVNGQLTPITEHFQVNPTGPITYLDTNTGQIYEVYEQVPSAPAYTYTLTNNKGLKVDTQIYCVSSYNSHNLDVYKANVLKIEDNQITLQFVDGETDAPQTLYVPSNIDVQITIGLKAKPTDIGFLAAHYCQLTFKAAATTHPKNWSEGQKMAFFADYIKIDTDKKTINYSLDGINWVGVAGIITDGTLFKLPPYDRESSNNSWNSVPSDLPYFCVYNDSNISLGLIEDTFDLQYNYYYE